MTAFVDYPCPTCHALPGTRCIGLETFGGAHATRITQAHQETP